MTFSQPLALLLLAAVPAAWWIHRARRSAQVVRVASLAPFSEATEAAPASTPRRAADLRLVLALTSMALLALAAAGPRFGAARPAAFYVVTDRSASMTARTCDAERRAAELLAAAAPGAEVLAHDLGAPGRADELPASLAPHLETARAEGFPGIVLVSDSPAAAAAGVAVIGPSAGALANVAVASAALDGDEALVTLRNFGDVEVAASVVSGGVPFASMVAARGAATLRVPAPRPGAAAEFRLGSPPDDLAADDRLVVTRRGGARRVRLLTGHRGAAPRLSLALVAAGAEIVTGRERDLDVSYGGPLVPAEDRPLFVVAPSRHRSSGERPASIGLAAGPADGSVAGGAITGRGALGDVLPAPGSSLAVPDYLTGGDAVWSDSAGVIAAREDALLVLAADPESAASDWHRDPTFAVFVAAALDELTGGPDRLACGETVPAPESDVVRAPPRTSAAEEIRAALRPAGDAPGGARPAPILALSAAVLLGAAAVLRRR